MPKHHRLFTNFSLLCIFLLGLFLAAPAAQFGNKSKKLFEEGLRHETAEQWDLAATKFAQALAAAPDNLEYRLHYHRARQNAAVMLTQRGDAFLAQGDAGSALTAYSRAVDYDPQNELARLKMQRILEMQKAQARNGEAVQINIAGNVKPSETLDIPIEPRHPADIVQTLSYKNIGFKFLVANLAQQLNLNVMFEESIKDTSLSLELQDTTIAKALDGLLLFTKHAFELVDERTIYIYPDNPNNRQRFERLFLKTFYLDNMPAEEMRGILQQLLNQPGKQIAVLKEHNAVVAKASLTDLKLLEQIIEMLDKKRTEVLLDVKFYEVSQSTSSGQQGGMQPPPPTTETSTSTDESSDTTTTTSANNSALNLTPNYNSLMQSRGNTRLVASVQIHAMNGEENEAKVGQRVPTSLGQTFGNGATNGTINTGNTGNTGTLNTNNVTNNIQYQDVGLILKAKPTIGNDGYIQVKLDLTSNNVEASGTPNNLTPTFTQRSFTSIVRIANGKSAIVAGVRQQSNSTTNAGLPLLQSIPLLGRMFSSPTQQGYVNDLIVTVTPHIIRSTTINRTDHRAIPVGTLSSNGLTIESLVNRLRREAP